MLRTQKSQAIATFLSACTLGLSLSAGAQPDADVLKSVLATETSCSNFVRFDDNNVYLGFGAYRNDFAYPRTKIPSPFTVTPIGAPADSFQLQSEDSAIDVTTNGPTLWLLTYSGLEEWNTEHKSLLNRYETYKTEQAPRYKEHPQAFARYQNKVIIAHGRLGVSFFDLDKKQVTHQMKLVQSQLPLESMATGVTVLGKFAYVLMDNFSIAAPGQPQGFRGLIVIDMDSEAVVAQMGGMDPGADAITGFNDRLIVSFMGQPLWSYQVSHGGNKITFTGAIKDFGSAGIPLGRASMDAKYYYTCLRQQDRTNVGHFIYAPGAIELSALLK
jgi:hypothetical protein